MRLDGVFFVDDVVEKKTKMYIAISFYFLFRFLLDLISFF